MSDRDKVITLPTGYEPDLTYIPEDEVTALRWEIAGLKDELEYVSGLVASFTKIHKIMAKRITALEKGKT